MIHIFSPQLGIYQPDVLTLNEKPARCTSTPAQQTRCDVTSSLRKRYKTGQIALEVFSLLADHTDRNSSHPIPWFPAHYVSTSTKRRQFHPSNRHEASQGGNMKPEDLHACGAPCTIVEPKGQLRKLGDQATMYFFVGYKYEGARENNILRLDDDSPFRVTNLVAAPTHARQVTLTARRHRQASRTTCTTIGAPTIPRPTSPPTVLPVVTADHVPTPTRHPRVTIRLPERLMNRSHAEARGDEPNEQDGSPVNEVSTSPMPDYPERSMPSSLTRDRGGGDNTMLISGEAGHPLIAFEGDIQLSRLPDPCGLREAMASPDADRWLDAMDGEMANLESHDVFELVPCVPDIPYVWAGFSP